MNNSVLYFNPVFPLWVILLVVALLFLFLLWQEFRKPQRYFWLRVIAQIIVLISIAGILFRPGVVVEKKSTGIVLLTPGYEKTTIDSLMDVQPLLRMIHIPEAAPYRGSQPLSSFHDLADLQDEIHFVVGEGIPLHALELMSEKKFQFISAKSPVGIKQLQLPTEVKVNQQATIKGVVTTNDPAIIILEGPGGKEDSVVLKPTITSTFSLKFKPKQPGLFVYNLSFRDPSGIKTGQLPVEVKEEEKLNILFLQKFPGFEVRQLKNFLAEKGHRLALRYQVSKNEFRFEYANAPSQRINPITSTLLQSFDLIMLSGDALEALSPAEKNLLEQAARNGLGMILLPSRAQERDQTRERFLPIAFKKSLKDTVQLTFSGKVYTLPVVPLQCMESESIFTIAKNKDRVLSGYAYVGLGKTGFQLLQETYRIALEGNMDDYARLWSPLLEKISRSKNEKFKIKLTGDFPIYPDEPLNIEVISTVEEHPTLLDDGIPLPLSEHIVIDNAWFGKSWAGDPGWHQLTAGASKINYFITDPSSWKSLKTSNQMKENEKVSIPLSTDSVQTNVTQQKPIPVIIFFSLFLLASGLLWLIPKI